MVSLTNVAINTITTAARPVVGAATPLAAAAATGYFLTDINHQYFEFLRKTVQSEKEGILSSIGNFSKTGGLYLLETAAPIVAFVALPLDPVGIAVRVGMITRGILAASNKTLLGLCLEAIKQLLSRLYNLCFGKASTEQNDPFPKMFQENHFIEITSKSGPVEEITIKETSLLQLPEQKSDIFRSMPQPEEDPITGLSREKTEEFEYLDSFATDSFSTVKRSKVDAFAAFRQVSKEMTAKAQAPTQSTQEEEKTYQPDDEEVDGGSIEITFEQKEFKQPIRNGVSQLNTIKWEPKAKFLGYNPHQFKNNSQKLVPLKERTTQISHLPRKNLSNNMTKLAVKGLKLIKK